MIFWCKPKPRSLAELWAYIDGIKPNVVLTSAEDSMPVVTVPTSETESRDA